MTSIDVTWWRWSKAEAVLQTTNPAIARKISSWKFSRLYAQGVNHYCRLFVIPAPKLSEACRLLGIPEPDKHAARVQAGKDHQANLLGQLTLFDANQGPGQDE